MAEGGATEGGVAEGGMAEGGVSEPPIELIAKSIAEPAPEVAAAPERTWLCISIASRASRCTASASQRAA